MFVGKDENKFKRGHLKTMTAVLDVRSVPSNFYLHALVVLTSTFVDVLLILLS